MARGANRPVALPESGFYVLVLTPPPPRREITLESSSFLLSSPYHSPGKVPVGEKAI